MVVSQIDLVAVVDDEKKAAFQISSSSGRKVIFRFGDLPEVGHRFGCLISCDVMVALNLVIGVEVEVFPNW